MAGKMTATEAKAKCVAAGCDSADFDKIAALPNIDLTALWQLVITYGPSILAVILSLFGQKPLPTPLPAPIVPTP